MRNPYICIVAQYQFKRMEEVFAEQLSLFCPFHNVALHVIRLWGHLEAPSKRKRYGNLPPLLIFVSLPALVSVASNFLSVNKGFCVLFARDVDVAPLDHMVKILK